MFEFKTKVIVEGNGEVGECEISWTLDLETRGCGVKSFKISVPDQVVRAMMWDEEECESDCREISLRDVRVNARFYHSSRSLEFMDLVPKRLCLGTMELRFS